MFYEPGKVWRDYTVTLRFESDAWLVPPADSSAALYVRYRGEDETSYRVDWNGSGKLSILRCEPGRKYQAVLRVPVPVETVRDGKPWTVRVRGDGIFAEHEGKRLLEFHGPLPAEGTVAFESVHVPMRFSDVEVR